MHLGTFVTVLMASTIFSYSEKASCDFPSWLKSCAISFGFKEIVPEPNAPPLPLYDIQKGLLISSEQSSQFDLVAEKYGLKDYKSAGTEVVELINKIYLVTGKSKLPQSNKIFHIRELEHELNFYSKNLNRQQKEVFDFSIANVILMLDRYAPTQYVEARNGGIFFAPASNPVFAISFKQYFEIVSAAINHEARYSSLFSRGKGEDIGFVESTAMRDYAVYNLWPLGYKEHDILHVRYILGHPLIGALYFRAARANNTLRFILMSMMFEAVDINQTRDEMNLARYMRDEMKFTIDQAMIYIAKGSDATLNELVQKSQLGGGLKFIVSNFKGWAPSKHGLFQGRSMSGLDLDDEIDLMVNSFPSYQQDLKSRLITNYSNKPTLSSVDNTQIILRAEQR
jgi:hypothetical protein